MSADSLPRGGPTFEQQLQQALLSALHDLDVADARFDALVTELRAMCAAMPDTLDDYTQGLADYALAVGAVVARHTGAAS